jgi:hypothetical protein
MRAGPSVRVASGPALFKQRRAALTVRPQFLTINEFLNWQPSAP